MIGKHGKKFIKYYPQYMLVLSLLAITIIGTILLALPVSRIKPIPLIDLFFTSASLTTVTGIMTVPLDGFTNIGQMIILLLMQIGGLGLMTLSLMCIYMFTDLGVYTQVVASEILSLSNFKNTKKILFFMIKLTVGIELAGAAIIFPIIYKTYSLKRAIFLSVFHSVSSFCNAGFTLFPNEMNNYINSPTIIFTSIILMIIGGLGFVTWHELIARQRQHNHIGMSWHTRLVVRVYMLTTGVSAILFWILERHNTLANMPMFQKFYVVLFTAVSMKSTGFTIVPFTAVNLATIVLAMATMFIGSAPLSTGSGIKTSVFTIYLAVIRAAIQGKQHAVLFGRHIMDEQVYKAMAIIALSFSWIVIATFCLLITDPSFHFIDILFESVSAFSNNGITSNITHMISAIGKCFIVFTMIIGRVGALAIIMSMKRSLELHDISYPKERLIMG